MEMQNYPVAIIGAGPVGLAAAAQLAVRKIPFAIFESGSAVAANVLAWRHVRIFSPWKYNIDKAAERLLTDMGWTSPDGNGLPTGRELYEQYLKPLSDTMVIKPFLHLNSRMISIGRKNTDKMKTDGRDKVPFVVRYLVNDEDVNQIEAKAVIDTSGTWSNPNPLGSDGTYAAGELENAGKIFYGIPDIAETHSDRYKNKQVLVVGSGHSSFQTVLELYALKTKYPQTEIHWVLRRDLSKLYGGKHQDALAARGALGVEIEKLVVGNHVHVYTPFQIQKLDAWQGKLVIVGHQGEAQKRLPFVDEIICATGARPDFSFLREVRIKIDSALESVSDIADLIDPNIHSCGTVRPHGEKELRHPEKDFYIAGSKSYGRAPTFLMATGYEQVRSIIAAIDGDLEAAEKVELYLPETGVCSTDFANSACCGVNPQTKFKKNKQDAGVASCCS